MNDRIEAVALLPCPFCGETPHLDLQEKRKNGDYFTLRCCHIDDFCAWSTVDEIAAAWNRRAPHYMFLGEFPGGRTFPPDSGGGAGGGPAHFSGESFTVEVGKVPDVPVYAPTKTPAIPSDTPAPSARPEDPSPSDQP